LRSLIEHFHIRHSADRRDCPPGDLLLPSPPAEKATACQDKAGQSSTGDGASAIVVQKNLAASKKQNKSTRVSVQYCLKKMNGTGGIPAVRPKGHSAKAPEWPLG
jgi:hypothetical protein